jgi:preprotein translocase subunit YajC
MRRGSRIKRVLRPFLLFAGKSSTSPVTERGSFAMFISPAFAQAAGASPQDTLTTFVLPMALIFVVFYFFMIRPQQQKTKQLKSMLEALRRGDRVVTSGGIIGTVVKVDTDQELTVEIADNVRVKVVRSTITTVLSKP